MNEKELVIGLKKRIIDSAFDEMVSLFNEKENESELDEEWSLLYKKLNNDDKKIFLEIIHQTMVDSLADMLAFLDGAYWIDEQDHDLLLTSENAPEKKLNENLTDTFLNEVYEWKR